MDLTNGQRQAIVNYLKSQQVFDNHLKHVKTGYSNTISENVKSVVNNLKKCFSEDEVTFLTSAAYRADLVKEFLREGK